jgi:hypothetical protein
VRPDSMVNDQHIEELAGLLEARLGGIVDEEARVMFRNLIPLLAEGQPVSPERIAAALKRLPEEITRTLRRLPNVELDERGNVMGAGLTLRPTPHRFTINGLTMFTWCALDALIFPGLLGQTVQVESQCKSAGIPVRLKITPSGVAQVEPPDAVVSLVIPDAGKKDVRCKVERPFGYAEKNLLNGRTFSSLEHLNKVTTNWLATRADLRIHQETKRRPIDLYQEEKPHLLPLPGHPYDTAQVLYRTVNSEGCVAYLQNFYSVPWQRIGELLPLRITEKELIVYGPDLAEIAPHELCPAGSAGQKRSQPDHLPGRDHYHKVELLKERFAELGAEAARFLDGIIQTRRRGKDEAFRVLGLLGTYRREDLVKALERACRYRAFSFSAVERILAAQARPRSEWEALQDEAREHLNAVFREPSLLPRPTAEYQELLDGMENPTPESEADDDGESA